MKMLANLLFVLVSISAAAHSPEEHMQESKAPDCKAMQKMDVGRMDMDDPVMKAMRMKCMDAMNMEHHMEDQETGPAHHDVEDRGMGMRHGEPKNKGGQEAKGQ